VIALKSVEPLTEPEVAVIVELPTPRAVASPVVVIVATEASDELQLIAGVTSLVVLSV